MMSTRTTTDTSGAYRKKDPLSTTALNMSSQALSCTADHGHDGADHDVEMEHAHEVHIIMS